MQREGEVRFSVIVPVYNVQNYLAACVGSVTKQPGPADWECILIDDGSTDRSGKICDTLAGLCPGVTVLHQPNGGVAAARNAGLAAARGEWLLFLDSDDLWPAGMLAGLRAAIDAEPDCDWFVGENLVLDGTAPGGPPQPAARPHQPGLLDSGDYALRVQRLLGGERSAMWRMCLRRRFVESSGLKFWPGVQWAEDLAFLLLLVRRCTRLCFLEMPFTVHREDRAGALSAAATARQLQSMALLTARMERRLPKLPPAEQQVIRDRLADSFWPLARAAACRDKAARRACEKPILRCKPLWRYGREQAEGRCSWGVFARTLRLLGPRFALWAGSLLK